MGVNPNNLLRDHVPQYPAGLEHLSPDGDLLDEMDAAYDYLTDLGNPHQDFLALAGPDENMRPQHARMLVCASLPQDTGACQLDEQFGTPHLRFCFELTLMDDRLLRTQIPSVPSRD